MPDIIGERLEQYVVNQILDRQQLHGKGTYGENIDFSLRTPQIISTLNSNTAWVKLASGVKIEQNVLDNLGLSSQYSTGLDLAEKNILYSGLSEYDGNKPLKTKDGFLPFNSQSSYSYGQYGFSPMPGIISADIKALNRGSIKKATVRLKAHNKQQFDIIDVLYLRLGYTVLLEWGNSLYITKNRPDPALVNKVVRNTLIEEKFFTSNNNSYRDYLDLIESKRFENDGNYDGLLGKISNFDWTFNTDGSYDITVTIISLGDIIESLKTNIPLSIDTINALGEINIPDSDNINRNAKSNAISSMLYLLKIYNPPKTPGGKILLGLSNKSNVWMGTNLSNYSSTGFVPTKWEFFDITANAVNRIEKTESIGTIDYSGYDPAEILKKVKDKIVEYANDDNRGAFYLRRIDKNADYKPKDVIATNSFAYVETKQTFIGGITGLNRIEAKGEVDTSIGNNPLKELGPKDGFKLFTDDPETARDTNDADTIEATFYITFRYLLEFIKSNCMPTINGEGLINLSTSFSPMYRIKDVSMSLDPRVCVVSTKVKKYDKKSGSPFKDLAHPYKNLWEWEGDALNIYLNSNFILDSISSATDERGDVNLYDFLSNICNGINKAMGSINNLEPVIDEEANVLRILDSTYSQTKKETEYNLNLLGYKKEGNFYSSNFIRKIDLRTAITPEYASMVTIGATAGGYVKGTEGTTFAKWNQGIIDRFKETVNSGNNQTPAQVKNEIKGNYQKEVLGQTIECYGLSTFDPNLNAGTVGDANAFYTIIKENVVTKNLSLGSEYFKVIMNEKNQSSMGFVPFKLGITMDGISGMKIYNKINVNTSFLPSNYGETLDFVITGVSHTLQNNDWVTEITTMAIPGTQDEIELQYSGEIDDVAVNEDYTAIYGCTDVEAQFGEKIESNNFEFTWTIPPGYGKEAERSKNINYLIDYFKSQGITNPFALMALIGNAGKESHWIPQNELTNYSVNGALKTWGFLTRDLAEQLLKTGYKGKDGGGDTLLNYVYGPKTSSPPGGRTDAIGNTVWGDGYKYRGRGFQQVTFKGTYEWISDTAEIKKATENQGILTDPDIINSKPEIAAVVYYVQIFHPVKGKINTGNGGIGRVQGYTSPCNALEDITWANTGWTKDASRKQEAFDKAFQSLKDINFKINWK